MMDIANKNIIVTGGAGLIGSHLVEELIAKNAKVIVPYIDILPKSKFALDNLPEKVIIEKIDITDRDKVYQLIQKYQPEYIFHLAMQNSLLTCCMQSKIIGKIFLI